MNAANDRILVENTESAVAGAILEFAVHFARGNAGKRVIRRGAEPAPPSVPERRVPRLSRLMALAIHFDEMIQRGEVDNFAQLAELGHVTYARISQIAALLNLAPDIQEEILFLPLVQGEREAVSEREIRPIVAELSSQRQRGMWRMIVRVSTYKDDAAEEKAPGCGASGSVVDDGLSGAS